MTGPPPLDLSHHFSYATTKKKPSNVKDFYKYFQIPGIANLAGGLPHASYFPYDTLEAQVALSHRFQSKERPTGRITVPSKCNTKDVRRRIDLTTALQYGTAQGYPPLYAFLRSFARDHLHPNVPYTDGPEVILTCGSTDGFAKVVEAFTNTWNPDRDRIQQREGVLCEEFAYMNAIQTVQPRGLNVASVMMDGQGMLASGKGSLEDVLKNWDFRLGRRPHLMYTVPTGQNPTGGTLSIERRKEIYALCQEYDVIIVEDEPYWNLQFPSAHQKMVHHRGSWSGPNLYTKKYNADGKSSGYAYLDSLVPSYLSIDTEGRVVRLDTFSKTIAPGSRLGWITAQSAIIERLTRITEVTSQQPSGFVQSLVAEMIYGHDDRAVGSSKRIALGWDMDGWVQWLEGLRAAYETRMQAMCTVLEENKYLYHGSAVDQADDWEMVDRVQMYDFVWPMGGMFTWIEICFDTHPLYSQHTLERLSKALWIHLTTKPYLCLVAPGTMFAATPISSEKGYRYIRLAFAPMEADEVAPFTQRLVEGFRSFWQRTDIGDLIGENADTWSLEPGVNFLGNGC